MSWLDRYRADETHSAQSVDQTAQAPLNELAELRGDTKDRNLARIVEEKSRQRRAKMAALMSGDPAAMAAVIESREPFWQRGWKRFGPMLAIAGAVSAVLLFLLVDVTRQLNPTLVLVPGTAARPLAFGARLTNNGHLFAFHDLSWTCTVNLVVLSTGMQMDPPPPEYHVSEISRLGPGSDAAMPCGDPAALEMMSVGVMGVRVQVDYRTYILGLIPRDQILSRGFRIRY